MRVFITTQVILFYLLAAGISASARGGQVESEKEAAEKAPPFDLLLDETPLPLAGKAASDKSDRDKVEALSLFSAARAREDREQYNEALRLYQRALRYDPQSAEIARAIVSLAVYLKREAVAIRYALKAAELEQDLDLIILRRLGMRLEEEGDWPRALKLYQRALQISKGKKLASSEEIFLQIETGRLLALAGKPKEAAVCFAVVVDALEHPEKFALDEEVKKTLLEEPWTTYSLFGDCFLQADLPDEAQAAFQQAQQLAPQEELWKFHLAQVLDKKGQTAAALEALNSALDKHLSTQGIRPFELLEKILNDLDKKDELIPRLEKLHANDPQNVPLGYFLASKYLEADALDKAEPLYAALVEQTPTLTGFKSLVEIYRKTRRFDALLDVLGETVEKTGVLDTLGSESIVLSKDAKLMDGLIQSARKGAIKAAPEKSSFSKLFAVGLLTLNNKQWETAGEFFASAAAADPKKSAEVYLVWGIGLLVDERGAEAAKVLQEGIEQKVLPENNPVFYFYLAGALAMEDRLDEALAAAQKAAEMKTDSVRFRSRLAWVYYHGQRYDEALREYGKLVDDFDDDYQQEENREFLKEVRIALSNICVLQKKIPQAQEWLEEVLDEFPDDPGALNDLGYLWADNNQHLSRALKMIQQAVAAEPDNGAYRDSLGWALFRLGRYEEALVELEKAAEKQPDGMIYEHLGDVYQRLDNREKAREAWRRAAELYHKNKDQDKAKEMEDKSLKMEQDV